MRNKISIIGAGNVGASCALWLAQSNVADLVLVDIPQAETMPVGKSLDLLQAGPDHRLQLAHRRHGQRLV